MEYQQKYTKEDVKELIEWFKTNEYPNELELDKAQHINDMQKCVTQLLYMAENRFDNPNFSGQIYMLSKIRDKILESKN